MVSAWHLDLSDRARALRKGHDSYICETAVVVGGGILLSGTGADCPTGKKMES